MIGWSDYHMAFRYFIKWDGRRVDFELMGDIGESCAV